MHTHTYTHTYTHTQTHTYTHTRTHNPGGVAHAGPEVKRFRAVLFFEARPTQKKKDLSVKKQDLTVGSRVSVYWKGDCKYYNGQVKTVTEEGFRIAYDDEEEHDHLKNEVEAEREYAAIANYSRLIKTHGPAGLRSSRGAFR